MAKMARSTLLDHKALIKANFARKGMDMKHFRQQAAADFIDSSDNEADVGNVPNVSSIFPKIIRSETVDPYGTIEQLCRLCHQ